MAKRPTKKVKPVKTKKTKPKAENKKRITPPKKKTVKKITKASKVKKLVKPLKSTKMKKAAPKKTIKQPKKIKIVKSVKKPIKKSVTLLPTKTPKKKVIEKVIPIMTTQKTPTEEYMNSKQQAFFRENLLNWKKQLQEEMERTVHHMQDEAANFPDPNDRATQEEEFSLELRARDRERKLIKKIDETLNRLDNNEYGYCEACGIEIGVKRLEARPTATLCIDCKTIDEIREKHFS
jgi:DnaK suppressor protein